MAVVSDLKDWQLLLGGNIIGGEEFEIISFNGFDLPKVTSSDLPIF